MADVAADLQNLTTDPKHQGRGAGTMLTRWGCEVAEKNGVPTFVQSSPAGFQTYKKCGFKVAYATDFDLKVFGQEGMCRNWLMVRNPSAKAQERGLTDGNAQHQ